MKNLKNMLLKLKCLGFGLELNLNWEIQKDQKLLSNGSGINNKGRKKE
ncbi:hypothetical protein SAMN05216333_1721 [Nitrosomonas oligotropha]|uniref:Uncharacterized protein n=1 Tax=Nitrosomonas oligotropha TaxID=42354 RepID=A0A1H8VQ39_9PROT|nr:hypothetical protein SAMN05216300_1721 [Nitrosomonas oligotropha]SEP17327.1 hypothetical protein SAMN05216333_1721 [Nitrosomonas oligotropha]